MARDDYFVIVYKILAYLYACLKEGREVDIEYLSKDSSFLDINGEYWEYVFRHLYEDGYLEGVSIMRVLGSPFPRVKINRTVMVTPKGIEFLQENSAMSKAKDFLKSIKETIPGL